jgi:hypothetical protein
MNKLQEKTGSEKIVPILDNGRIQVGGRIDVELKASLPGSVEGEGDAKFFFRFPTWLTLDFIRKFGEHFKQNHDNQ